jgi:lysozyme
VNLALAEELCRRFEGFRARPYLCPAGVPTIGYGSTHYADGRRVQLTDPPIAESAARALLVGELLDTYAPGVLRQCPGLLPLALIEDDWQKLNAIVDFAYNLGVGRLQTSTLRRRINAGDFDGAVAELGKWVWGGGRKLPGLVARRAAEAALLR